MERATVAIAWAALFATGCRYDLGDVPRPGVGDGGRSDVALDDAGAEVHDDQVDAAREWSWRNATPAALPASWPAARMGQTLVYDPTRKRVLLFGGTPAPGVVLSDLWEWDGAAWTALTPKGATCPARFLHAAAYDSGRGRMVVYGGHDAPAAAPMLDTWEFDSAAQAWFERKPPSSPGPHIFHGMAFDQKRSRSVMAGPDTWEWDGDDARWLFFPGSGSGPAPRESPGVVYDAIRGQVVMWGGRVAGGDVPSEMWEWDGSTWAMREYGGASPTSRYGYGVSDEPGTVVVFSGGDRFGSLPGDTWTFDTPSGTWSPIGGAGPPPRGASSMAFDVARGVHVVFGGWSAAMVRRADVWELVR